MGEGVYIWEKIKDMAVFLGSVKTYNLGSGFKGSGLTIWDRNQTEAGDYKTIAHINSFGKITYYQKNLPKSVKNKIEKMRNRVIAAFQEF